jgi:hypothetical protein
LRAKSELKREEEKEEEEEEEEDILHTPSHKHK